MFGVMRYGHFQIRGPDLPYCPLFLTARLAAAQLARAQVCGAAPWQILARHEQCLCVGTSLRTMFSIFDSTDL